MSKIGKNIKKIRSIKNLSQSDFADLFELKRASVGSYEEGRAEPKITTIITIANYFGITTDDLLKKDLTINEFYKFDIFKEDLIKTQKHNLNPSITSIEMVEIPFVSTITKNEYLSDTSFVEKLETIKIPLSLKGNLMAFEINDNSMNQGNIGIQAQDIVICKQLETKDSKMIEVDKWYVFNTKSNYFIRLVKQKGINKLTLNSINPDFYALEISLKEIKSIWEVHAKISNNISNNSSIENRLAKLENDISKLVMKS